MLDRERYLDAVALESSRLREAASEGLDLVVPTCPDWDARRLVSHVARLHRWVAETADRAPEPVEWGSLSKPPFDEGLLPAAEAAATDVVADLRRLDSDAPIQSWAFEVTALWWCRRLAHETAIHRQDAQLAAGVAVDPVDADLAVDGVDEALTLFLPLSYNAAGLEPASVHLHATDAEGEWIVRLADSVEVEREHVKGDAAARGAASDLFSVLWRRRDPDVLDVLGDADAFARLVTFTSL
jgi:uncharacterized protein (TIGR03083 family)